MSRPCINFEMPFFVKKNSTDFQLNFNFHHYNTMHKYDLWKSHNGYSKSFQSSYCMYTTYLIYSLLDLEVFVNVK